MFPNPWATSVPPSTVPKPTANSYENNTASYPFYAAQNAIQNISQINQQNNTLNTSSVINKSLQPNAIDPAMVQKWQEWKQWELWQQQFQQWQQQTGQISVPITQTAPMPPGQPLQPTTIPFQNQQFSYGQSSLTLPLTNPPLPNQQSTIKNEIGMKRGLEPDFQNNEKKLKIDIAVNKKEIELNDETEALFEEQFKSWEEQFLKWKEQNKNHPDKTQYLEYEKKWITWRDHLKQKCEALKKKRELKITEKKKGTTQGEENQPHSQQLIGYNPMSNVKISTSEQSILHNNNSVTSTSESQIPGLDLGSSNTNVPKGFLNVARILPQNQNGPIQTPDDKPFNFPKNITNPTTNQYLNMPTLGNTNHTPTLGNTNHTPTLSNTNQPPTSMYQSSPMWSNNMYKSPVLYNNQKPSNVDSAAPISSRFSNQTDNDFQQSSNTNYNSLQNTSNMNYRRSFDGSYNKPSNETNPIFNKPPDDQSYNRNFNASSNNFRDYSQPNTKTSSFNKSPETFNIPYQQPPPSLNTTSKPPSLLSLNVAKPISLDKPSNYLENKNIAPNRYERNWNINDEDDDPENEYMEAHKKFSSEPFDEQNNEDQFSNNKQYGNMYNNDNHYSRGHDTRNNFNDDYSRPSTYSKGSQMMRNTDNAFFRSNSQYFRNDNQNYTQETKTLQNNDDTYYNIQNNTNKDQGFSRGMSSPLLKDVDGENSHENINDKANFVPHKSNYGTSPRGNYGPSSRGKYGQYSRENYGQPSRGNFGSSSRGNYGPPSRVNYGALSRNNYGPPSNDNYGQILRDNYESPVDNKSRNMDCNKDFSDNERLLPSTVKDSSIPSLIPKIPYQATPIDPVKIFDYRHIPTLKVIPGLIKETVIPIRIYDYKHGGKRILPWQDRGYSRRNSNQIRDLDEKEGSNQDYTDCVHKNKETSITKPKAMDSSDILSDEKNFISNKNKTDNIKEILLSTKINTVAMDDNEKEKEQSSLTVETIDINAPSPPKMSKSNEVEKSPPRQLLTIETLLCPPGRFNRPSKIVIILRGLPGSGKSYVARLIKEKEVAMGGQAPRILSLDDYFMTEVTKTEIDPETNKKMEIKEMEYEHDSANENLYRTSFIKAFKKKISENYFSFFIIDAINNKVSYYKDILDISRVNGFTVYIIELESDVDLCIKRNIHKRTAHDINSIMRSWVKTPSDQILLDIRSLLDSSSQNEVEMEDVSDVEMELDKDEETQNTNQSKEDKNVEIEEEDVMKLLSCKWTDTIPQEEKMKRLDGLCKKKTEKSIKEWLQIPEENYTVNEEVIKDGKKRVRWADMEERLKQEKMRAIGFVVGQTDWNRMLGQDQGESKLTQTKYI